MNTKVLSVCLALLFLLAAGVESGAESEMVKKFKSALYTKDSAAMTDLVKENRDAFPAEIELLLLDALTPGSTDRAVKFELVEYMASEYGRVFGDTAILKDAKKRIFESRLSKVLRPEPSKGVFTVESVSTGAVHNVFVPDNIIVRRGTIVRWVNKDTTDHLLASVPVIGSTGIFSTIIKPGEVWEYKFDKPGEYYYICFIHKVMYGKVTVEE